MRNMWSTGKGWEHGLAKLTSEETSENARKGWEHGVRQRSTDKWREHYAATLGKLTDAERAKNASIGGKIVGAGNVEFRRGIIGRKMEEWEAYFPTLEAFVEENHHSFIPKTAEFKRLYDYVRTIRESYKKLMKNDHGGRGVESY